MINEAIGVVMLKPLKKHSILITTPKKPNVENTHLYPFVELLP